MTTEQDLVVDAKEVQQQNEEKNVDNFASGGGGVENAVASWKAIDNGDWDTAGLSVMSLGIDAIGLAADPLGTLASWGVGWLIENVGFLRDAFDALMGDPDEIAGMATTWENVGREVQEAAEQYRHAAAATTDWEGKAGDAYRKMGSELADHIEALSASGKGMKGAVEGAGTVVSAVRGIVRDLIATAVGEIVAAALRWLAASVATAGIAIGGAIADAIRIALKFADKISGYMKKLGEVLHNLWSNLDKLGSAALTVRQTIDDFFRLLSTPPEGNLVNVGSQKPLTDQSAAEAARYIAPSTTTSSMAKRGFLAGGSEFKPWMEGDIFQPHIGAGGDGGMTKLATDTVKEYSKLDDGKDEQQSTEDQ